MPRKKRKNNKTVDVDMYETVLVQKTRTVNFPEVVYVMLVKTINPDGEDRIQKFLPHV